MFKEHLLYPYLSVFIRIYPYFIRMILACENKTVEQLQC